jgi:hypothetical protein
MTLLIFLRDIQDIQNGLKAGRYVNEAAVSQGIRHAIELACQPAGIRFGTDLKLI